MSDNQHMDLRKNIFLIGETIDTISNKKLATNKQALQLLFHYTRDLRQSIGDSCPIVISEIKKIWDIAEIPTQDNARCVEKLNQLYTDYRQVQKIANRKNKTKEQEFCSILDKLFDIAHSKTFDMIDIETQQFLIDQRTRRVLHLNCIAKHIELSAKSEILISSSENQVKINESPKNVPLSQSLAAIDHVMTSPEKMSDTDTPSTSQTVNEIKASGQTISNSQSTSISEFEATGRNYESKHLRGTINILTEDVVAVLDSCNISYRQSVRLTSAMAPAMGVDLRDLVLNKSSFHEIRRNLRKKMAEKIKLLFNEIEVDAVVIHWDGKLIPDSMTGERIERLPILITCNGQEKILGVPALPDGCGSTQAEEIFNIICEWDLNHSVKALCCDTTVSNLGWRNGAAVILERKLGRDLLYLPCRHHIYELVLSCVHSTKMPGTTGPNVPLFKKFQNEWSSIDTTKFESVQKNKLKKILRDQMTEVTAKIDEFLNTLLPRDDYRELLELSKIFLGTMDSENIKFYKPGAFHHARWMSKAIYCLKIYIFRKCFKLTKGDEKSLQEICLFIVFIYVPFWYTAPLAATAPKQDLEFLKVVYNYRSIDKKLSEAVLAKFRNHLWYLSPEAAALSFFDENISSDVRRKMVAALTSSEQDQFDFPKRFTFNSGEFDWFLDKNVDYFINSNSIKFFERFNIDTDFLLLDESTWSEHPDYLKGLEIVKHLKVVNDSAERAVKLTEEYINTLAKHEDQKQYVIQIVSEYKKKFPNATKECLIK